MSEQLENLNELEEEQILKRKPQVIEFTNFEQTILGSSNVIGNNGGANGMNSGTNA